MWDGWKNELESWEVVREWEEGRPPLRIVRGEGEGEGWRVEEEDEESIHKVDEGRWRGGEKGERWRKGEGEGEEKRKGRGGMEGGGKEEVNEHQNNSPSCPSTSRFQRSKPVTSLTKKCWSSSSSFSRVLNLHLELNRLNFSTSLGVESLQNSRL